MKKVFLMILSLAMVLSSMTAGPVLAAGEDELLPEGYKFMDIAYDGAGTYAAMAKNENQTSAYLFYSHDDGLTWHRSTDQPLSADGAATIYSNKSSQQQLVWWDANDMFIVHGSSATYISTDGDSWDEPVKDNGKSALHWTANAMFTVSGDKLVFGGGEETGGPANATSSTTKWMFSTNKYNFLTGRSYYSQIVAAKPEDESGVTNVLIAGYNMLFRLSFTMDDEGVCSWSTTGLNSGSQFPMYPYDALYAKGADQYLFVDGSKLYAADSNGGYVTVDVKPGVGVTGLGANDSYIAVGMSDGTMYYTANAPVTAETQWTEIPVSMGEAASEPIKNIEFSDETGFIALGETQIYKGTLDGYFNIKDYVEIGDVTVSGQNVFTGVRLIGGAYSPTLNKYVVYGDTAAPDAENKYWGKIFVSDNGLEWRDVYTGYTFTQRTTREDGTIGYGEVRNGTVWWESQGLFIISASILEHTGVTLVSEDGEHWSVRLYLNNKDEEGNLKPELDTDMQLNVDLAIGGDNLYTTNNGRQFRTYTAWNKASMTSTALTQLSSAWYLNQISVSDENDPAVLMAQNEQGAVRNNESDAENELDKWTSISNLGNWGALKDSVFSESLNKFVAVLSAGNRTSIISKDGTVERGPVVSGKVCTAIDTNGEAFMFACEDGNVYTAADSADFASAALAKVPASAAVDGENTMPLTNVVKAGENFIATATDNTDSDVLLISKNNDGAYEYAKASESAKAESLVPGQTITISVDGVNNTESDYPFALITAVYSDGVLVQVQTDELAITSGMSGKASADVALDEELPENSEMKIFIWDSMSGMKPIKPASTPF